MRSRDELLADATAGARYLEGMQGGTGAFRYTFDPYDPRTPVRRYNILRHAGTAWALLVLGRTNDDPRAWMVGSRAVDFLLTQTLLGRHDTEYVVDAGKAKLGALGLTLLALSERLRLGDGAFIVEPHARRIAAQIDDLQREDGRFESFVATDAHPTSDWSSLYYPGEAMLGLATFSAVDGDPSRMATVHRGIEYLIRAQRTALDTGQARTLPPDAWLLQAIEAAIDSAPDEAQPRYLDAAMALADAILEGFVWDPAPEALVGSYRPLPGGACRTAARAEGLLAAVRLFDRFGGREKLARIEEALGLSDRYVGRHAYGPGSGDAHGGIAMHAGDPSVRIDTVQHSMAMWMGLAGLRRDLG